MIYRIYSSLESFKTIELHPGLNVLLAKKEKGATDRQTRNRAGKSSLVETIHFLAGAKADPDSPFRSEAISDETFGMDFGVGSDRVQVERRGSQASKIHVTGLGQYKEKKIFTNSDWTEVLGESTFGLRGSDDDGIRSPTFRSLFSYFVRRQKSDAFVAPEKNSAQQAIGDYQVALMYLLGMDWKISSDWQAVRDREKTLKELKKAASSGAFGTLIGKASELRTKLAVEDSKLQHVKQQLQGFRVLPQYRELEVEANELTKRLSDLSNQNVADEAVIRDLQRAMQSESPPELHDLEALYAEAGVVLPGYAIKRYEEVRSFHESVVRNRRDYLSGELDSATLRIAQREAEKGGLDIRRAAVFALLQSHGALDQFSMLQSEVNRLSGEVEVLRHRFESAEQLEGKKNELDVERGRLEIRLRRDFSEQSGRLSDAILAFEETSKKLYASAGSMTIDDGENGPQFKFPMQGSRSKGIKNMQIFCFDMMLMRLCAKRNIGPGFLVHDSHLFDGVDGRQVISALKVGAETAEELGFQYIVTMNEDDALKEKIAGFDLTKYVLPTVLTDATDDGGLFGIRF